ncbi:MAG: glycogen debranching enzyme, partial [Chloroflexota bacterium]|nr:glycogen debranching enzyme [Chloroflexota bacterium]
AVDEEMLGYTRRLIALRRAHPVFRRRRWFRVGVPVGAEPDAPRDIEWCKPDGTRMQDDEWHTDGAAAIAVYLSGEHLVDREGEPVEDDSFYLALNATAADLPFRLPGTWLGGAWACVFDTAAAHPFDARTGEACGAADEIVLAHHSMIVARRFDAAQDGPA